MINKEKGFTLIELLVVIAIIGLLASVIMVSMNNAKERGRVAGAGSTAKNMATAVELYYSDMGFYPPDVSRGWDPGLAQSLPYNPDTGQTIIPVCDHCPADWTTIVTQNWNGPYISVWPQFTPWDGKYDYNHWPLGAVRYGCTVPPGIYIGVQGDYTGNNTIPNYAEQLMIDQGFDADQCINNESQIILQSLQ
jgi:prepilin-type N-terminal cleavage/methylation domain-containing protein